MVVSDLCGDAVACAELGAGIRVFGSGQSSCRAGLLADWF